MATTIGWQCEQSLLHHRPESPTATKTRPRHSVLCNRLSNVVARMHEYRDVCWCHGAELAIETVHAFRSQLAKRWQPLTPQWPLPRRLRPAQTEVSSSYRGVVGMDWLFGLAASLGSLATLNANSRSLFAATSCHNGLDDVMLRLVGIRRIRFDDAYGAVPGASARAADACVPRGHSGALSLHTAPSLG